MSFLPADWRRLAHKTDALKGLRQNKSEEDCLRTLLIHLARGYSLRETALRAREAHLADLSDVALLKRLRKSEQWLYELCCELFRETHLSLQESGSTRRIRLVDATHVKEPEPMEGFYPLREALGGWRVESVRFAKVSKPLNSPSVFKRFKQIAQLGHLPKNDAQKRQSLALRQDVRCTAGGKACGSREFRLPLGISTSDPTLRVAPGENLPLFL